MTAIEIPIVAGPGTQPAEPDGADLAILQLPSGMDTYAAPLLPEPEDTEGLDPAKRVLGELLDQLRQADGSQPSPPAAPAAIDVAGLDAANLDLVDQVLGEGEVSMRCDRAAPDRGQIQVQEAVLAGVWRVRVLGDRGERLADRIEVGAVPAQLHQLSFADAADRVSDDIAELPDGVLNAPSLLTEINDKVAASGDGAPVHVINLTLLPQTEQDLAFLAERLGQGRVTILSRGYGNCRISSTATRNVWWVQYFNSQDRNILNTLEVTAVPAVACAAPEDIRDSATRLDEILAVYR